MPDIEIPNEPPDQHAYCREVVATLKQQRDEARDVARHLFGQIPLVRVSGTDQWVRPESVDGIDNQYKWLMGESDGNQTAQTTPRPATGQGESNDG